MVMGLTYCVLVNSTIILAFLVNLLLVNNDLTGTRQALFGLDGLAMIAGTFSWLIYWVLLAVWIRRLRQRVVLGAV